MFSFQILVDNLLFITICNQHWQLYAPYHIFYVGTGYTHILPLFTNRNISVCAISSTTFRQGFIIRSTMVWTLFHELRFGNFFILSFLDPLASSKTLMFHLNSSPKRISSPVTSTHLIPPSYCIIVMFTDYYTHESLPLHFLLALVPSSSAEEFFCIVCTLLRNAPQYALPGTLLQYS